MYNSKTKQRGSDAWSHTSSHYHISPSFQNLLGEFTLLGRQWTLRLALTLGTRTALTTVILVLTASLALETTSTTSTGPTAAGLPAVVLVVGGPGLVVGSTCAILATVLPLPITLGLGDGSVRLLSLGIEAKLLVTLLRRELVRRLCLC